MVSKKLAALAALSLVTASSAAAAQSAQSLSLANSPAVERTGADLQDSGDLNRRGAGIYIIGAIVIALLIWGGLELFDGDDGPDSP